MASKDLEDLDFFFSGNSSSRSKVVEPPPVQSRSVVHPITQEAAPHPAEDLNDDWGAWESPITQTASKQFQRSHDAPQPDAEDDFGDFETGTVPPSDFYSSSYDEGFRTPDSIANGITSSGVSGAGRLREQPRSSSALKHAQVILPVQPPEAKKIKQRDDDVLFDAADFESEDDFGGFEQPTREPSTTKKVLEVKLAPIEKKPEIRPIPPRQPQQSLLDFDNEVWPSTEAGTEPFSHPEPHSGPGMRQEPATSIGSKTSHRGLPSRPKGIPQPSSRHRLDTLSAPQEPSTSEQDFDGWDDFDSTPNSPAAPPATVMKGTAQASTHTSIELPHLLGEIIAILPSPPANIPPPSILLTIFPPLFSKIRTNLLEPLSSLSPSDPIRANILQDGKTRTYLTECLIILSCMARIVAGRKLRWKRDTILAQSMRIAAAGGRGGMKLTGLDKSESTREDREAEDTIALLNREVAGRLKSAVAAAGLALAIGGTAAHVPDITLNGLPIRIASQNEGAVTAPKPCAVCGVKRNERIRGVDGDVQDAFGEWWVEHWGHVDCTRVWLKYESTLKSR